MQDTQRLNVSWFDMFSNSQTLQSESGTSVSADPHLYTLGLNCCLVNVNTALAAHAGAVDLHHAALAAHAGAVKLP